MKRKLLLFAIAAVMSAFPLVVTGCDQPVDNDQSGDQSGQQVEQKKEEYVVSFNTMYGSSVPAQLVEEGGKVTVPDTPDRAGYTFGGWYKDEACTAGQEFSFQNDTISATTTIYAKWVPVEDESVEEVNGFVYTVIEGTETLSVSAIDDYDYGKTAEVLSTYNGMPVVAIADYGMESMDAAQLILPNTIEKIGKYAFFNNTDIAVIDMNGSSAEIGEGAFAKSGLMAIDLGGATKIGEIAFQDSLLSFITIPATVTEIGDGALDSDTLTEIAFAGEFPVLGEMVFGESEKPLGDGTTELISFYATQTAWNNLVAGVAGDTFEAKVEAALDVDAGYIMYLDRANLAYAGVYYGDKDVYMGVGSYAVVLDEDQVYTVETYDHGHVYTQLDEDNMRSTILLDYVTGRSMTLEPNERGEVIEGTVLYDYVGTDAWYDVSSSVTEVAAGAGAMNSAVRFVTFGDNVTDIGDYVFFNSNLFSVSFGENIDTIGAFAFSNASYIQEIIFRGETAPSYIGDAAFCYIDTVGFIPVAYANEAYGAAQIWTPLEYSDGWYTESEVDDFLAVFNASLEALGDQLAKDGDGNPIKYVDGSSGMFNKLSTYGLFMQGKQYTTDFGSITMSGTGTKYMYVTLNEDEYVSGESYEGPAYGYWSYASSDDDDNAPVKIEIFYGVAGQTAMSNFFVYGKFDSANNKFVTRGGEYGVFGELGKEIINLDGYGTITYNAADGSTYVGTYTKDGNTLTVTGIDGITTITFTEGTEGSAASIAYGTSTLTALGSEAGVYYDYANRAKLEMDGKAYTEGQTNYSGKLVLTYNGVKVAETGYVVKGATISFTLNGVQKDWDYSRTASDYVVKGYYGDGYNLQMKFIVERVTSLRGTFTGANGDLVLDGYFNATLGEDVITYSTFGDTANIAVFDDEGAYSCVLIIDTEKKSYTVSDAAEAGMYYVSTSSNYRLYFDGQCNVIYFTGDAYKYGTYEYNAQTKVIKTKIDNDTASKVDGSFDVDKGYGYVVYDNYGDTFMAISRQPFGIFPAGSWEADALYPTLIGYSSDNGTWSDFSLSLTIKRVGNVLFISEYGKPFIIYDVGKDLTDGVTFTVNMTTSKFTAKDVTFKVSVAESGAISFSLEMDYEYGSEVLTIGTDKYMLCWLNKEKTQAGIYELKEYGSSVYCGEIKWSGEDSFSASNLDMSSGEYFEISVTGYGTAAQKVTLVSSDAEYYNSSDAAEYNYYKINVYSDTMLWVSNGNISGASPETAAYTKTEKDGVTYYTFTSKATGKVVTFHFESGGFVVDSEE